MERAAVLDSEAYAFAPKWLKKDRELLREVIAADWRALRFANDEFRADPDIVQ